MGCGYSRISKTLSYSVLRKSVIGALIPEDDFLAFYNLCRTDIHTITSQVFINQNQLFFVVVAGEVVVNLTSSDSRPRVGLTHKPGELIHFFHGTECTNSDGTVSSGGLKLSLSFVTLTTPAIVIGVERASVEDFVRSRPHLTKLKTLLNLNLANFLTGPNSGHFRALTYKQLNILGPLLKLRLTAEEEHIKYSGREITLSSPVFGVQKPTAAVASAAGASGTSATNNSVPPRHGRSDRSSLLRSMASPSSGVTRLRQLETDALNNHFKSPLRAKQTFSPTFVVLHGLIETMDMERAESFQQIKPKPAHRIGGFAHALFGSLRSNQTSSSLKYGKVHTCDDDSDFSQMPVVMIPRSPSNNEAGATAAAAAGGKQITPNSSQSPRHKTHPAGTIVGLEHFLAGKYVHGLPNLRVVGDFSILAHMDLDMLKVLTSLDKRLQRVLSRNYVMKLLDSLRDHVPMISDMDEKAYTMLCSTIALKSYAAGEVIYKQGDESKFAYIVVNGSVQQNTEITNVSMSTINKSASYSPHAAGLPATGPVIPGIITSSGRQIALNPEAAMSSNNIDTLVNVTTVGPEPPEVAEEEPPAPNLSDSKVLGVSGLFGEVALVTEVPYLSTTTALEPTLLVAISKGAFNEIYNNNKATLAEIRIRMVGSDIGLQAILDHPLGCKMFQEFVEENRAGENLHFYTSADKFDDMCTRLKRHMNTLRGAGSMKHGGNLFSGRMTTMMFDEAANNSTLDMRGMMKSDSGMGVGVGGGTLHSLSPRDKVLETITENQSVASEKTMRLDMVSEKRSNLTSVTEEDLTVSHKISRKEKNGVSSGMSGVNHSLIEEGSDPPSPSTVTGDAAVATATGAAGAGNNSSAATLEATYTNLSVKTLERGESELMPKSSPHAQTQAQSTAAAVANKVASPRQQPPSGKNGVRLVPLPGDASNQGSSSPTPFCPELDDVLMCEDTYIAQGIGSNPNSLRIGSTSNVNSMHVPHSSNGVAVEGGLLQDSPVREESSKTLRMKFQKIEKTTTELQEVARTIMERYINEGAPSEINIPSAVRARTQQMFEDWVSSHQALNSASNAVGENNFLSLLHGTGSLSFSSIPNTSMKNGGSPIVRKHMNTPFFQLDYCDMFHEPKQEILKLLKADLFVRWKKTKDFQYFIASMKPYEEASMHSNHSRSSRGGGGSQPGSYRKVVASAGVSRESSFNKGLRALSMHR